MGLQKNVLTAPKSGDNDLRHSLKAVLLVCAIGIQLRHVSETISVIDLFQTIAL